MREILLATTGDQVPTILFVGLVLVIAIGGAVWYYAILRRGQAKQGDRGQAPNLALRRVVALGIAAILIGLGVFVLTH